MSSEDGAPRPVHPRVANAIPAGRPGARQVELSTRPCSCPGTPGLHPAVCATCLTVSGKLADHGPCGVIHCRNLLNRPDPGPRRRVGASDPALAGQGHLGIEPVGAQHQPAPQSDGGSGGGARTGRSHGFSRGPHGRVVRGRRRRGPAGNLAPAIGRRADAFPRPAGRRAVPPTHLRNTAHDFAHSGQRRHAGAPVGGPGRLVRSRAREWRIDPQRVGVQGYSAGANLCLNLAGLRLTGPIGPTMQRPRSPLARP